MTKIKKFLAILLITAIILPIIPIGELKALAAVEFVIKDIRIIKEFDKEQKIMTRKLTIAGENLIGLDVKIDTVGGSMDLGKFTTRGLQTFEIKDHSISSTINRVIIGDAIIELNEGSMPNISANSITPKNLLYDTSLTIKGNNLNLSSQTGIIAKMISGDDNQDITNKFMGSGSQVVLDNVKGNGLQSIIFEKPGNATYIIGGQTFHVETFISYNYYNQFMIYKNIEVEGLQMTPNSGKKGTTVRFEAPVNSDQSKNLRNHEVFFLSRTDGTDPYSTKNMGKNRTNLTTESRGGRDYNVLTVQVPDDIDVGEYFVVLTNPMGPKDNPADSVVEMKILDEKFTVIQGGKDIKIDKIEPNRGADTGVEVTITGMYIGTMNIDEFKRSSSDEPEIRIPQDDDQTLIVDYGGGTFGKGDNKQTIVKAEREIKTIIGDYATYLEREGKALVSFTEGMDTLKVKTAPLSELDSPRQNVVIITTTIFTRDDGTEIVYVERAELKNGFEYIPSKVQPEILSITPSKIQVVQEAVNSYRVPEGRQLAIHGNNFMIHKYIDKSGNEVLRYPKIEIGTIVIDKNDNKGLDVKVLDSNGNILDGTENKELGTKILITMPENETVNQIGSASVTVINPMRNTNNNGYSDTKYDFVEFIVSEDEDNPVIEEVRPNTSPVEGGEKVTIVGSNFQPGLKVYIDGEEVKSPQVKADGRQIDIVTPKGRETKTQIQVVNPKGGMDWKPFTYIMAYSQPKITSFNPPQGEKGTPVVIKGSGFLFPDPMSSEEIPEKLIGTRVLLGDPKIKSSDVNEYNMDHNGEIEFREFNPNTNLFTENEGKLIVADFYSGIMLESDTGKKYIVEKHPDGRTLITDRSLNRYIIEVKNGQIQANKTGGAISPLVDTGNGLEFDGLRLKYKTAYKYSGSEIIGQHARVIDENTIYFYVPERPARGYYDLTVINPDTKKDTREGNKGFLYLSPVGNRPTITNITPNKGDVSGGYPIRIEGSNFSISDQDKPKVYIDGQLAVITEVAVDGRSLVVTVPKYTGNLRDKETSQLPVLVVVQNPGGLSAGSEKLFSYIIPNTQPKINRIRPNQGSTAGDMVEIDGIGFLMQEIGEDLNGNGTVDDNLIDPNLSKELRDELAGIQNEEGHIKPPYSHYYKSDILPKVYFGNDQIGYKQGKVLDFDGDNYLRVLAPENQGGKVDVYITNNDGGTSNRIPYTYIPSAISIKTVNPSQSRKQGGIKADVRGTGFQNSTIDIFKQDKTKEKKIMPLVRFGDLTNKNLPREHENSGLQRGPIISVRLDGGLEVEYRTNDKELSLQIKEEDKYYKLTGLAYNNETVFVPVNLLKSGEENYKGIELIKISLEDKRLLVERGYAPTTKLVNGTHIELETPSYFEAKKNVPISVVNPDKAEAKFTNFNYTNPESEPVITNVQRDNLDPIPGDNGKILILQVNHKGGREIKVLGRDFRKGAKITIEDFITIKPEDVEFISEEELRFIMPELMDMSKIDGLHKLRVENEDGGNALSTDAKPPIYIQFTKGESEPAIDNLVPNIGPATGGTRVTIHGNDFRTEMDGFSGVMKVFFGEIQATNVIVKDYKTLEVIAPPSDKLGPVKVTIENPDGTLTQDNLIFTYISKPKINDMDPKKIFTNDTKTEVTIKGEQFLQGAKVIVGGKIISTKDLKDDMVLHGSGIRGVDGLGNNIESSVVGGQETATVLVESDGTIKVTFAEATDLENTSIIIINPDGGISEAYDDFKYEKPLPLKPMVLEAIPGYESTVMLIWNESDPDLLNRASNYEIYGRKTKDQANTFVGTTEGADFLIKGLEANTEYEFLVRALNEHGSAIDFATVIVKTLSVQEDYKQKEKEDKLKEDQKNLELKGKEVISGNKVIRTLGREDIKNGLGIIDFSLSKYKNSTEYIIQIPLGLARTDSTLTIKDSTLNMTINPKDLYTYKVSTMDEGDKDANLEISIKKTRVTNIPRGKKVASQGYELDFMFQRTKERISIDKLLRSGKISLKLDSLMYTGTKNVYLAKFNIQTGVYEKAGTGTTTNFDTKGKYILLSDR